MRMIAVLGARAGGCRNGRDRCRYCPVARRDPPGMSLIALAKCWQCTGAVRRRASQPACHPAGCEAAVAGRGSAGYTQRSAAQGSQTRAGRSSRMRMPVRLLGNPQPLTHHRAVVPSISELHSRTRDRTAVSGCPQSRAPRERLGARSAVILSPFGTSPGHEGFLRLRHVADVRFWARLRTQKRSDKGIDAGHVGDIASGASQTPLKITRPRRSSKGP